jgi:hypothetical protein
MRTIPADVENMIHEFETRKGDVAFTEIERKSVADELRKRIEKPSKIDQGQSSLCGPAVFIYCLAKKKPKVYARYIIDLYEKGEATIGRLKVKPGHDCKNYKLPIDSEMVGVDWIALAGLRDSENAFLDYDEYNDQVAGITLPSSVSKWFAHGDFSAIRNNTNLVFDKGVSALLKVNQLYMSGACVCLFIGANGIRNWSGGKAPADHWVVLESSISIDGKPVSRLLAQGQKKNGNNLMSKKIEFSVFTWANSSFRVNKYDPNLTVEKFLDYFYGYVAAQ